jgi:hypothetical protein
LNSTGRRPALAGKQGTTETINKTYFGGGKYEIETVGGVEKQRLYVDGSPYEVMYQIWCYQNKQLRISDKIK